MSELRQAILARKEPKPIKPAIGKGLAGSISIFVDGVYFGPAPEEGVPEPIYYLPPGVHPVYGSVTRPALIGVVIERLDLAHWEKTREIKWDYYKTIRTMALQGTYSVDVKFETYWFDSKMYYGYYRLQSITIPFRLLSSPKIVVATWR